MLDSFKLIKNAWFDRNTASLDDKFFSQDYQDKLGEFAPYYTQHIKPLVKEFETQRLKRLRHLLICKLIIFPLIIIAIYFKLWLITCILVVVPYLPVSLYSYSIEKNIYPLIFQFFDEKATYEVNGTFKNSYNEFGIVPQHNQSIIGNYVALDYKEVHIELLEAELIHTSGSGRSEHNKTVFKGLTVILNMNKSFHGKTLVKKDPGKFGKFFEHKPNGLEIVKLEDQLFENMFEVYSSNQVEARYLLTPTFMERLLKISKSLGNKGMQCSFYQEKLFMMFELDDQYFVPSSIFSPATFIEMSQNIIDHMKAIFTIIETLKLYQNTKL